MADFSHAINLICKYEGFNEKAYADLTTDAEPYTIGYGTQYYPDGSPVKRGQHCSQEKALEYLFQEVGIIDTQLSKLNLGLDESMCQALISFIHSIGWEPFLYSSIIEAIEEENFHAATKEISSWIFDEYHKVIGGLLDRRREETNLFLQNVDSTPWDTTEILLTAFREYSGTTSEIKAVQELEENISPYILSKFANEFNGPDSPWETFSQEELNSIFTNWS